jgi:hypothetical protein
MRFSKSDWSFHNVVADHRVAESEEEIHGDVELLCTE